MIKTSLIPTFKYRDAPAAIDLLCDAFGFERHQIMEGPNGTIAHAELKLGDDMIMLGSLPAPGDDDPLGLQAGGGSVYVIVDDVEAHHARATAAGVEVVLELRDTEYGSREYTARDPDGNLWSFGTYRP